VAVLASAGKPTSEAAENDHERHGRLSSSSEYSIATSSSDEPEAAIDNASHPHNLAPVAIADSASLSPSPLPESVKASSTEPGSAATAEHNAHGVGHGGSHSEAVPLVPEGVEGTSAVLSGGPLKDSALEDIARR
jgi:hypothetical protein